MAICKFLAVMRNRRAIEWTDIKELSPLQFMPYMAELFKNITGKDLQGLSEFTGWIGLRGYYHWKVAQLGLLQACPHLQGQPVPEGPMARPSGQPHLQRSTQTGTPVTGASGRHQDGGQLTSDWGGKSPPQTKVERHSPRTKAERHPPPTRAVNQPPQADARNKPPQGAQLTCPQREKQRAMVPGTVGTKGPSGGLKGNV